VRKTNCTEMLARLSRIAAECGAEIRQTDGTPADLAAAVLECDDPPRGEDRFWVEQIHRGNIVLE
jgi:hypothetical protein